MPIMITKMNGRDGDGEEVPTFIFPWNEVFLVPWVGRKLSASQTFSANCCKTGCNLAGKLPSETFWDGSGGKVAANCKKAPPTSSYPPPQPFLKSVRKHKQHGGIVEPFRHPLPSPRQTQFHYHQQQTSCNELKYSGRSKVSASGPGTRTTHTVELGIVCVYVGSLGGAKWGGGGESDGNR